ncbi:MAG: acyl-CoA dehydrogenase family protein [Chloroflexota bacterium]|nr:acyl-CoA dehydrogenase family protein [Chloroflexota bacterium]MDQ5867792.1 acyl-CoA dehydrogenase family protein [Chloroflexota bacterium]
MDFNLTPKQIELRNRIRNFAERELAPTVSERDEAGRFDRWVFDKCVEAGLAGLPFPESYCGAGGSILDYIIALEEIGRVESAQVLVLASHVAPMTCLLQHGTEEQKQRWLAPMCKGETLACFSLTEPGAGSDPASMKSRAVRDGDSYVLNGRKTFATNSGEADVYILFAMTDPEAAGRGISAFIIPRDTPGLSFGEPIQKMGVRTSVQREIYLEDVRLPSDQLLGQEGGGLRIALAALDVGRIEIAAQGVGLSQGAYDFALNHAKGRVQFGQAIGQNQAISFMLADMHVATEAARMLTYRAAMSYDEGKPFAKEAAMAKLLATDTAMKVTTDAVQILGGFGVTKASPAERFMRDAKVTQIYEGTNQVQRMVIAGHIMK